ncbi:DUF6680 family protein [Paraburkholderia steynii]|uniref:DUF6680 family protein n=1 Tax=Paraburkholderia steynii TaxID=1245441 RepID=UPI001FC919A8|nr:DUF6680 family protein [Paraburkholderia steynii]
MVISTILGPILTVQAQKFVERARASAQRRDWVFSTLMATRQARVSFDDVRALNMIDLTFYGRRVLGRYGAARVLKLCSTRGMTTMLI